MTTDFRSNTSSSANPPSTAYDRVVFDNLLRRELKVADPSNPQEVADALLRKYQSDPRALALTQEALGLPFQQAPTSRPVVQTTPTATDNEWQQAVGDVERDLRELTTSALLKDLTAELTGWSDAIRSAMREGDHAARFGLDPHQRDRAFSIRRQLGDYARVARLAGTLNPPARNYFRQLACSLDEASSVILVQLGEALGNAGYAGGKFLLQSPYSELQTRRDAAVYALRNLIGATQEAYGPNDWPRGLDAYRQLYTALEDQGQGDLRSLLVESELARIMDELIQRAAHGQPDGLRAVGATAQVDLARFRRLVMVANRLVRPESPPLTAFLQSLALFADAFTSAGGYRLLRIARPPILLYGLYGAQGLTHADRRLLELVSSRSELAELVDCVTDCECQSVMMRIQAILDSTLYYLDRAIDLYALGDADFGAPEMRASAFAYYILAVLTALQKSPSDPPGSRLQKSLGDLPGEVSKWSDLTVLDQLEEIVPLLAAFSVDAPGARPPHWETSLASFTTDNALARRRQELTMQWRLEQQRFGSIASFTTSCIDVSAIEATLKGVAIDAMRLNELKATAVAAPSVPAAVDDSIEADLDRADTIDIPPHMETSFDGLVHDVLRDGTGRGEDDEH